MAYVHFEIVSSQSSKKSGAVCGDLIHVDRQADATTLILADGIGSGIKANLAATLCISHIQELLRGGYSLREAFQSHVQAISPSREPRLPYAAFSLVRFLREGETSILQFDAPPPILICRQSVMVLPTRTRVLDRAMINETTCLLEPGDSLILMSDGITQAGLGKHWPEGWQAEGVRRFIQNQLSNNIHTQDLPEVLRREACRLSDGTTGDDCTVSLARCRPGNVVNILTGPPLNPNNDNSVVFRFLQMSGHKVICGGTTSGIVGRVSGKTVKVQQENQSLIAPPLYEIEGVDLVTEGAITLNQVYNILDSDPQELQEESGVTRLYELLRQADRINFLVGRAQNPAGKDISFRQRGILPRHKIVHLLAEKLTEQKKLVVIEEV